MRNKSKNRYNTLHRLTSIVEEKDILAAKELMNSKEDEVFDWSNSKNWSKNLLKCCHTILCFIIYNFRPNLQTRENEFFRWLFSSQEKNSFQGKIRFNRRKVSGRMLSRLNDNNMRVCVPLYLNNLTSPTFQSPVFFITNIKIDKHTFCTLHIKEKVMFQKTHRFIELFYFLETGSK